MTERSADIEHLFNQALEMDPIDRVIFLDRACDDPSVRKKVESLLESYEQIEDFLQIPAATISAARLAEQALESEEASAVGKRVGVYRIEKELGRGGMGAVYLASRDDEAFERRVAIKLLRHDTENEFVLRRFLNERQILAKLDHPNIARLIDGGITDNGLPYFVMEYVEGVPINRYCTSKQLSIEERLTLFRDVCSAVEFAHRLSVIHRDIKPSNILVTESGTPKLLDFGIAKVLDGGDPAPTATAFRMMTPEYASPEQMRGEHIGKQTDVYSLGVLLYLLVTNHQPYDIDNNAPYEMVLAVCEKEPIPPSVLMEGLTDNESIFALNYSKTHRSFKKNVDNIILKALRKDPERRYSMVADFAADIKRCLDGLAPEAGADPFSYRAKKFFNQHRAAILSAAAAVFITVALGFSFGVFRGKATSGLDNGLTEPSSPSSSLTRLEGPGSSSNSEARNRYLLGEVSWNQRTEASLKKALEYFEGALQADPNFALAYSGLSNTYFLLSVWGSMAPNEAFPKAKVNALRAIEIAPDCSDAHLSLAMVHWLYEYDWGSAEREFTKATELDRANAKAFHWQALFLAEMGRSEKALGSVRRALEIEPHSVPINADIARVLFYARRYQEAAEQYLVTVEMSPNYEAFYSEMLQLYEAVRAQQEPVLAMNKFENYIEPSIKSYLNENGGVRWRAETLETWDKSPDRDRASRHYLRAELYAQNGQRDRAFQSLQEALNVRDHRMAQLKVNPKLDNLRGDSRFTELLQKLKLNN